LVNNHSDASSADCGNSEDRGAPLAGDLYVGHFGDMIMCKKKNTLRSGLQNVGGLPINKGKIKRRHN